VPLKIAETVKNIVIGQFWVLLMEELRKVFCSPTIVRILKRRRIRMTGYAGRQKIYIHKCGG
jgi:hypothetical protein